MSNDERLEAIERLEQLLYIAELKLYYGLTIAADE